MKSNQPINMATRLAQMNKCRSAEPEIVTSNPFARSLSKLSEKPGKALLAAYPFYDRVFVGFDVKQLDFVFTHQLQEAVEEPVTL